MKNTHVIILRPQSDISVTDLGEPAVALTQDMVFINPDPVIDTVNNCISVTLTEEETLRFMAGIPVDIQQIWKTDNDEIVRFPVHQLSVEDTIIAEFDDEVEPEEPEVEPEETEEIVQDPEVEEEDDSEEPEYPLIWDDEDEDSEDEYDDLAYYQLYDEEVDPGE